MLKNLARFVHGLLPDSALKRKFTAVAYRLMYHGRIKSCHFNRDFFSVVLKNGIEIKSVREFDPEPLVSELYSLELEEDSVVLDLGGHFGIVSVYLSRLVGENGKVITFEADQKNFEILKANLVLNGVENVEAINLGVYNKSGVLEFHSGGSYTSSFHETNYVERNQEKYKIIRIPVVTLDEHLADLDRLDFVKMDIEGSEIEAIQGGKTVLGHFLPRLLIETHIVAGKSTSDEVIRLLKDIGYKTIDKKEEIAEMPTLLVLK